MKFLYKLIHVTYAIGEMTTYLFLSHFSAEREKHSYRNIIYKKEILK